MNTPVKMYTLLLLTLFSTAYANVFFDSMCPEVKSAVNFDFSKFGNGEWYEIARYPNDFENETKCVLVAYTWMGDHTISKSILVQNDKQLEFNGIVRPVVEAGNPGKLSCSLSNGSIKFDTDLYILDIDYDNYAIIYNCKYDEEKKSRQDFAWIMSRSSTLSPAIKAKVDNFVKESEFLYYDKLVWPETLCKLN